MASLLTNLEVGFWRVRRYVLEKRVSERPKFEDLRFRFYDRLWQDTAAKIGAVIEDIGHRYYRIARGQSYTFVHESKVMLDNHLSLRMAGNKPLVHQMLTARNYPVQEYLAFELSALNDASRFMEKFGGSFVVKPASGAAGNGITTKIRTPKELRKAALLAATFSTKLLIEREIPGSSYRILYLRGKFLDAIRRDPPTITGDGKSSIQALIARENKARLQGDIVSLFPIEVDYECLLSLKDQGLTPKDVPGVGESIPLKTVVNQNASRENHCVKDEVHPSIIKTGEEIARLFQLELLGLDIIATDLSRPLSENQGVINEINTTPGIHHHYLISNPHEGVDIAREIIEEILFSQGITKLETIDLARTEVNDEK